MSFTHDELRRLLSAYRDGELDDRSHSRVAEHLASCDACSGELEDLEQLGGLVEETVPMPSPAAWDDWQLGLEQALQRQPAPRRENPLRRVYAVVALAASLLIAVFLTRRFAEGEAAVLAFTRLHMSVVLHHDPAWKQAAAVELPPLEEVLDGQRTAALSSQARAVLIREGLVQVPCQLSSLTEHFPAEANTNLPAPLATGDASLLLSGSVEASAALALERTVLMPGLREVLGSLARELRRIELSARSPQVRRAARLARERFGVAALLTGVDPLLPKASLERCQREVARIREAADEETSLVLPREKLDYRAFRPRGIYAQGEALRDHARAVRWLSLTGFALDAKQPREVRAACLVVLALARAKLKNGRYALWQQARLEAVVEVLFGEPDELTPFDVQDAIREGLGRPAARPHDLTPLAAVKAIVARAERVGKARGINQVRGKTPGAPRMFLLGNTRSIEGRVFTRLTHPALEGRSMPTSLDLLTLLGSRRARTAVSAADKDPQGYDRALNGLQPRARFWRDPSLPVKLRASIERGRLWALAAILRDEPRGPLPFHHSAHYRDRLLLAAFAGINSPPPGPDQAPLKRVVPGPVPQVEPLPRLHARLAFSSKRLADALEQIDRAIGRRADLRRAILRLRRVAWLEEALRDASLDLLERRPMAAATHKRLTQYAGILRQLSSQGFRSAEDIYELDDQGQTKVLNRVTDKLDRIYVVTLDSRTLEPRLACGPALAARELVTRGKRLTAEDLTDLSGKDPLWAEFHVKRK